MEVCNARLISLAIAGYLACCGCARLPQPGYSASGLRSSLWSHPQAEPRDRFSTAPAASVSGYGGGEGELAEVEDVVVEVPMDVDASPPQRVRSSPAQFAPQNINAGATTPTTAPETDSSYGAPSVRATIRGQSSASSLRR